MSSDKSTTTDTTQTTERTADQIALDKLSLEQAQAAQGGLIQSQGSGLELINQLLTGGQLPGFLQGLPGGISEEAIGNQATQLTRENMAGFNNLGLENSGVAFRETSKDIANNLLFPAEQFNIGNMQNLLNLALSGQAQVQSPILGSQSSLGDRLSQFGTTTGTSTSTSQEINPFLSAALGTAGTTFGGATTSGIGQFIRGY